MIQSHIKKLNYPIPLALKAYVFGIIVGESKPGIQKNITVHANRLLILIYIYHTLPNLHFKTHKMTSVSRLNVGGQIKAEEVFMEVNGQSGQLGTQI